MTESIIILLGIAISSIASAAKEHGSATHGFMPTNLYYYDPAPLKQLATMTEDQYNQRHAIIMAKIYRHSEAMSNGSPKFPRCLKADIRELKKLEQEWILEKQ